MALGASPLRRVHAVQLSEFAVDGGLTLGPGRAGHRLAMITLGDGGRSDVAAGDAGSSSLRLPLSL